jgi:His/Glu/Gln/Arg/opine family amino acid ABC transporter permease subunit
MNYNWDWMVYFAPVSDADATYLDWLLQGLGWTVAVSLCAWVIALVLGIVVGTLRTVPQRWVVRFCTGYVELFRNIPLLVQMFLWFFVVPELLPLEWSLWIKQELPAKEFVTAIVALGLFTSARVAEQVRSGIQSLPRGQRMAGQALGLTLTQTYRYVILPMAMRIIIPPLTSEFMNVFKNSSVAYAISVVELFSVARQMSEETARDIETLLAVTLLYFLCAFVANRVMAFIERRVRVPGYMGGPK